MIITFSGYTKKHRGKTRCPVNLLVLNELVVFCNYVRNFNCFYIQAEALSVSTFS